MRQPPLNWFATLARSSDARLRIAAWQSLSYLALPAEAQIAQIGPTRPWFILEKPHINPGGNYWYGMLWLVHGLGYAHVFDDWAESTVTELDELLGRMLKQRQPQAWSAQILRDSADWQWVRRLAAAILEQAEAPLNPPKQALWLPDWDEIWWDDYREMG